MFWVLATMVPISLLIGVLAGMREGRAPTARFPRCRS
jgi:hypothetical protein